MSPGQVSQIQDINFKDALGERYLAYALSTIMSRSLPDVRDGLKPVHRRLIYAMQQLKLHPEASYKKCARIVGDVIGKFHPHGELSIYEALVRLAQVFTLRYPLIDGQGNFGNVDGDSAAAMRYTEARFTKIAEALLEGLNSDAVDFKTTYDGEFEEPVVLPAKFPNLLANGALGIAVGMATSIPPHNIDELFNALVHLLDHPEATITDLLTYVQGPDFPTGGIICDAKGEILKAYETGRGSFRVRARYEIAPQKNGLYEIIVTEIPYQVQKSKLIEKIADLLLEKKLMLLADIRDESTEDIRLVFVPKSRTVDPEMLMASLFKNTDLEVRIGFNMNVVDKHHIPKVMNLKEVLGAFLEHRHEVLVRCSKHRMGEIQRRLEILDGYLIAFINLDEVIRIIRQEDNPKQKMMEKWGLSDLQVDAILNMRLRALQRLEELALRTEHEGLTKELKGLEHLLSDEKQRSKTIKKQLLETQKLLGADVALSQRRTTFMELSSEVVVPIEALIEKEPVTVVCSEKGWVRALKGHIKDLEEIKYKEGDSPKFLVHAYTTDKVHLFATNGRFYTLIADKLPKGRGFGEPLRLMIDLDKDDDILSLFIENPEKPSRLLLVASDGRGFITYDNVIQAHTRGGKQVLSISGKIKAHCCHVIQGDYMAIIGDNRRMAIFPVQEIPEMQKGRGVILQKYRGGGISDLTTFQKENGLKWVRGTGIYKLPDWERWIVKRGAGGRFAPVGFPRSNKFGF